jgi:acetyl-CoA acetyltransferase family protein
MSHNAQIPYGAYWSTPFAKWQGSLAHLHSVEFGAYVAKNEMEKRNISADVFDYGVMGISVPQKGSFYGAPWFMGMIGAKDVGGPAISQACATGVRTLQNAVQEIDNDFASVALVANVDRVSNGPHLYYPNPQGPGGKGGHEDWTLDNMQSDPLGGHSMLQTAENVAARHQVTTEAQHEVVLRREEQYQDALADDSAFLKRFMTLPFDVPSANYKKTVATLTGDEGLRPSNAEGLAKLRPVMEGGTVTFGGQTHPADGNACIVVATPDKARELSKDKNVVIEILGFGMARAELAYMPEAPVPAAMKALEKAGLTIADLDAVKTHNPFAANDIYFSSQTGYDINKMNNYGCPLVWGHPQAPMGTRGVIELIEELVIRGGGTGLFTGCAAGDTAMATVVKVSDGS